MAVLLVYTLLLTENIFEATCNLATVSALRAPCYSVLSKYLRHCFSSRRLAAMETMRNDCPETFQATLGLPQTITGLNIW